MGSFLRKTLLKIWLIGLVLDRVDDLLHWVHQFLDRSNNLLDGPRVSGVSGLLDLSDESGVFVGRVLDSADCAVWFNQLVVTLHLVAVTLLVLFLDVVCVLVFHAIFELVTSWFLRIKANSLIVAITKWHASRPPPLQRGSKSTV